MRYGSYGANTIVYGEGNKNMANNINGYFVGEIEPTTTIAGCISIYERAWPNPEQTVARIEQECADADNLVSWQRAETIGGGVKQSRRTNLNLGITYLADIDDNAVMQNTHNQMNMLLNATVEPYCKRMGIEGDTRYEDYSLLKYSGGQNYGAHHDGSGASSRVVSAICYLNDDYEGGELEFPHFGVKIKPQAGMLIVFPSNFAYAHIAHPVTDGTKYAIVTWINEV